MKKMSLLALVLIVGLPGCCGSKKEKAQPVKQNTIKKYIDTPDVTEETDVTFSMDTDDDDDDDDDQTEEEDEDMDDDEDDDMDDDEDDDIFGVDFDDDQKEDDETSPSYTWIDTQADDEFKKLYFTFNHYGIKADQKEALSYNIDQIKQLITESGSTQLTVLLEGHACQEGSPAYNVPLSEKRAKYVADLFVAAGVDRSMIKVVGRGQEYPEMINGKVVNGSREERALNRRVEIRVIYT